ncbi:MAG: tetratricopeptide repeat protein [Deltaproteobacteria bacterium]|nr:tetratricopeptide repeat protein [Deltaproteobacteria bacterium]
MKKFIIGVVGIMVLITLGCSTTKTVPLAEAPAPSKELTPSEMAIQSFASGNIHAQSGNYEDAIKDFTQAITINPGFADAYYNRGRVLGRLGKHEQAISDFTKTISLTPENATAYADRGTAYGILGQHEQAIDDFTQAINLNPDFAGAYYNRAIGYFAEKKCSEAREDVQKAQNMGYQRIRPEFLDDLNKNCPENK